MKKLLHPFDDPVLAALLTKRGYGRDEVESDYSPARAYSLGDLVGESVHHPETVQFFAGDNDGYHGSLVIVLNERVTYLNRAGTAHLHIRATMPNTIAAGAIGRCVDAVMTGIPGAGHLRISAASGDPGDEGYFRLTLDEPSEPKMAAA